MAHSTSPTSEKGIYQSLDNAKDEIRVLQILPCDDRSDLNFRLHRYSLNNEMPKFWAFSYTWGDYDGDFEIVVDDLIVKVTGNLYKALQVYRSNFEYGLRRYKQHSIAIAYLWVDALCINQSDLIERAQQVLLMRRIYRQAVVGIFLENENKEADNIAHDAIFNLTKQHDQGLKLEIPENSWKALHDFFSKPWFKRMWMIQEFILAQKHPFMFWVRTRALTMDFLWRAADFIFKSHSIPLTTSERVNILSGVKQCLALCEIKRNLEVETGYPSCLIIYCLWMFRDRNVTNPRDKIYSLLGLLKGKIGSEDQGNSMIEVAKELDIEHLIIDYGAPVEQVYASLVKAMVQGTKSLNIICACQNPNIFTRSWVPDWSQSWSCFSLLTNNIYSNMKSFTWPENTKRMYHASGNRSPLVTFSEGLAIMKARGIAWDGIAYLIKRPLSCHQPNIVHWVIDVFESLSEKAQGLLENTYGKSTKSEFLMASLAGYCNETESHAWDYRHFYPNAKSSRHRIARNSEGGGIKVDGRPAGFVEARHAQVNCGRQMFIGENGYCGLVPDHAEVGDLLCVLFGCDTPVVLRPVDDCFILIGECYIHHLMQGESIQSLERDERDFEII